MNKNGKLTKTLRLGAVALVAAIAITIGWLLFGPKQVGAAQPVSHVKYELTISGKKIDLKDFPGVKAIVSDGTNLYFVSDDDDINPMCIVSDKPLTLDEGKQWATLMLRDGVTDSGILKVEAIGDLKYMLTAKDEQLEGPCCCTCGTDNKVPVDVTKTVVTPTPPATNTPEPTKTPEPTNPPSTKTPEPTKTPVPTVEPTKTPVPTEVVCTDANPGNAKCVGKAGEVPNGDTGKFNPPPQGPGTHGASDGVKPEKPPKPVPGPKPKNNK